MWQVLCALYSSFLPGRLATVRRLAPACCRPETREPLLSRVSSRLPREAIITMNNPTKKCHPCRLSGVELEQNQPAWRLNTSPEPEH